MDRTKVGVVGSGYWGINHVRVFANLSQSNVTWLCDANGDNLQRASRLAPLAHTTQSIDDMLKTGDADIEAVVIATPAPTHHEIALKCLRAGKHVLVEKPLALSSRHVQELRDEAQKRQRTLAVGHLMLHHPVVTELKRLVDLGELGQLYYLHATRVNLGRLRHDENALWSFGPHDLSMIDYLLETAPISVSARGACYLQDQIEDVVFVNMRFAAGQVANIHLSWLNPRKERRLTVVGSKKMVEFDDVSAEKLRVYDKGYDKPPAFEDFSEYLTIRHGDVHIPHIPMREPLVTEALDFLHSVRQGTPPIADGESALRMVLVLEAAQESLRRDGEPIRVQKA